MDTEEAFQLLMQGFDQEELFTLYFELVIDYRGISTLSKSESAAHLLNLVNDSGRLSQLLAIIKQQRPHLFVDEAHSLPEIDTVSTPTAQSILEMDRMALYIFLISHFNFAQIRTACSDLGVDEKQLSGTRKVAKARELIIYLEDNNRLADLRKRLVQHVSGKLPLEENEDVPFTFDRKDTSGQIGQSSTGSPLVNQIAFHFSQSEFKTLCFDLEIDYDDLPGTNDFERIGSLISIFKKRNQIGELLGYLNMVNSSVSWKEEV